MLTADDALIGLVEIVLESMGTTSGEFGRVIGLKQKRSEIAEWMSDEREAVRRFSDLFVRRLDSTIAAEQRRSEESLALRKLEYEPVDPVHPSDG